MNNIQSKYIDRNGYSLDTEFHQFMEQSVIPATRLRSDDFWSVFTAALDVATSNHTSTCTDGHCVSPNDIQKAELEIPLGDASLSMKAINSRWGSLYDALYTENVIPHTAGLKPVNGINMARRDRVVSCTKDFLDKTFPLTEGSHRDAVSYMVYFQNLLVILADGSTTGLKKPRQFVGKNGPTNEPESILLKHTGMHAEIIFDRNGKIGKHDLANIDDIQLEAANHTLFKFTADSIREKCTTYKNWFDLVNSDLSEKTFTDKDGEVFVVNQNNWSIKLADYTKPCLLVLDQHGTPVSEAIVDALTAALIYSNGRQGIAHLNMYIANGTAGISDALLTELGTLLALSRNAVCPVPTSNERKPAIQVLTESADSLPSFVAAQQLAQLPTPQTMVISALESHGYSTGASQLDTQPR